MEIGQHPKIGILIYVLLSQVWNSPNPIFEGKQTFFQEMSNILSAPVKNEPQIEFFSSIQTEMIECFCRNRITTNEIEIDFKVSRLVADFFSEWNPKNSMFTSKYFAWNFADSGWLFWQNETLQFWKFLDFFLAFHEYLFTLQLHSDSAYWSVCAEIFGKSVTQP